MSLTIDIHALQTLPPSLINRDDTGAPKSAIFGGVVRQRVSSQAWKHAIRKDFETYLNRDDLGMRTKRVVDLIATRMAELDGNWTVESARPAVEGVFAAAKISLSDSSRKARSDDDGPAVTRGKETGYLLFLSQRQIDQVAQFLIDTQGEKPSAKQAKALLDTSHSIDIAMFGRMVADNADYNVDAAVQVAHAIGVSESEPEFDFFTAVDEGGDSDESGAGMLGTVQMMSSTLYRFASIDLLALIHNLGDTGAGRNAAIAFVRSFIRSLPTGKLNTFANWTLPELVLVTVRDDRAVSLVNAFESPVSTAASEDRREAAAKALAAESGQLERAYGLAPRASWVVGLDALTQHFSESAESTDLDGLLDGLAAEIDRVGR